LILKDLMRFPYSGNTWELRLKRVGSPAPYIWRGTTQAETQERPHCRDGNYASMESKLMGPILTIEQVSELLNVKPSWIYQRTCDGSLRGTGRGRRASRSGKAAPAQAQRQAPATMPHYKCGKLLRFDRDEVMAWFMQMHCDASDTEGAGEARAVVSH